MTRKVPVGISQETGDASDGSESLLVGRACGAHAVTLLGAEIGQYLSFSSLPISRSPCERTGTRDDRRVRPRPEAPPVAGGSPKFWAFLGSRSPDLPAKRTGTRNDVWVRVGPSSEVLPTWKEVVSG